MQQFVSIDRSLWVQTLKSLPNDKFLGWSKLKAFADENKNVTEKLKFVLGSVGNRLGKRLVTNIFSICYNVLKMFFFFSGSLKVGIVWLRLNCCLTTNFASLLTLSQTIPGFYVSAVHVF